MRSCPAFDDARARKAKELAQAARWWWLLCEELAHVAETDRVSAGSAKSSSYQRDAREHESAARAEQCSGLPNQQAFVFTTLELTKVRRAILYIQKFKSEALHYKD